MRKGISFTLTIIIVGVVLLTAALTLVTIFGSGIGSIFGTATDTGEQAAIRNACNNVVRQIDNQICEAYVGAGLNDLSRTRDPSTGYTQTCNEAGCELTSYDTDVEGNAGIPYSYDGGEEWDYVLIEVNVDGNEYNCADQGYLPTTCPVN